MKVFDTKFKVFSNETEETSLIFSSVFLLYYNYSYVCTFAAFVIETPKGVLCASISEEEHTVVAARKKTSQRKHIKLDSCPPCCLLPWHSKHCFYTLVLPRPSVRLSVRRLLIQLCAFIGYSIKEPSRV